MGNINNSQQQLGKFPAHRLKEGLNVLSLFDGMGCIWEVLESLGVKVANGYSSEIDRFANTANHHAHPYVKALGDVRKVKAADLPKIDLVCGGSPCQGLSFAGKQLKFDDPRSALFWEYVRIMEEVKKRNPDIIFFLENVRMDKQSETVITRAIGIQPILINSALVCAQNRERNYWTNIGAVRSGLFGDVVCGVQQPKDRGVFLRDILQPPGEIDRKYYLSQTAMKRFVRRRESGFSAPKVMPEKTGAITTKSNSGQLQMDGGLTLVPVQRGFVNDFGQIRIVDKSTCIDANYSKGIDNKHARTGIIQYGRGYNKGGEFFDKCPPITANSWQNNHTLKQVRQINGSKESGGKQPYQQNRVYDMKGISPAQSAGLSTGSPLFTDGMVFRRLTVIECCRLQGIRDDFFFDKDGKQVVSTVRRIKCLATAGSATR